MPSPVKSFLLLHLPNNKHAARLLLAPPSKILIARSSTSTHRRNMHALQVPAAITTPTSIPPPRSHDTRPPPLSLMPLTDLIRSYAITAVSSYPLLLNPSLRLLSFIAHSQSMLFNPDRNPVLHWILKRTFYAQFCAGESAVEVQKTVARLKDMGFKGVILNYGKELIFDKSKLAAKSSSSSSSSSSLPLAPPTPQQLELIETWKASILATIAITSADDFVAIKFSGAGPRVMEELLNYSPTTNPRPSPALEAAIDKFCQAAKTRGVGLLFDAEQFAVQDGIDGWTMDFQRRYNRDKAVVYGTYQTYLQRTPGIVAQHLAVARRQGFVLGVKLVRGAYMGTDPRELFWPSKDATDRAFDGVTSALMRREYNDVVQPVEYTNNNSDTVKAAAAAAATTTMMPEVALCLASHNQDSIRKAMACRLAQTLEQPDAPQIEISYAQLMGMADEISCELVQASRNAATQVASASTAPLPVDESVPTPALTTGPKAYKYVVWGSVGECLKYLVRRAEENRDAVTRATGTREALWAEMGRRLRVWQR